MRELLRTLLFFAVVPAAVYGDGPKDNIPENVRRIPKLGIEVAKADRAKLSQKLDELKRKMDAIRNDAFAQPLLPDVEIYYRAVHDALRYQEFFKLREVADALDLLAAGIERVDQLGRGQAPWTTATGLVVRGYVSGIDGSVQPYGLVLPDSYTHKTAGRYRLDIWFHGRGETLSEVNFLSQRSRQVGQFAPADTIVLHPYGRYSNAFKFAGEVDVLEALESVRSRYRVDDDRTSVRGFSMGGAACWQFAVHYSDRWFAANPGAGFSETPQFLEFFQQETLNPTWYEKRLWRMYDCNLWADNLRQCPTVAYSGEIDRQKQAADVMEKALAEKGIELVHIVGPQTAHRYHPAAKTEVTRRLDSLAAKGRATVPREVSVTTYTLKYNRMNWVTIDGIEEHWQRSHLAAAIIDDTHIRVTTENVTDFTLQFPAGWTPLSLTDPVQVSIDGVDLVAGPTMSDRSWKVSFHRQTKSARVPRNNDATGWTDGPRRDAGLRKRHNLQGPVDDAFMDAFLFVRPTRDAWHKNVAQWSESELERAIEHWRRHFRGHARVKRDIDITDEDIASSNLILWGDAGSNAVLERIAGQLPIKWNASQITIGSRRFPADQHAVIAIYPNPLNPKRYVVLNSSFTFRAYAYLNNARQVAKLPDWAVVDLRTPPDTLWPGKIVAADFFDERWQLKPPREK